VGQVTPRGRSSTDRVFSFLGPGSAPVPIASSLLGYSRRFCWRFFFGFRIKEAFPLNRLCCWRDRLSQNTYLTSELWCPMTMFESPSLNRHPLKGLEPGSLARRASGPTLVYQSAPRFTPKPTRYSFLIGVCNPQSLTQGNNSANCKTPHTTARLKANP